MGGRAADNAWGSIQSVALIAVVKEGGRRGEGEDRPYFAHRSQNEGARFWG